MVERFEVIFTGRTIARGFASRDVKRPGYKNVSVMPIDRSGDFAAGTLEIHLPELISGGYPDTTPTTEALNELLGMAKIEPHKVSIVLMPQVQLIQPPAPRGT